jgi:hypothetical protein
VTKLIIAPKLGDMPREGIFGEYKTEDDALEWGKRYEAESVVVFHRRDGKSILAALVFRKKGKRNG